MPKFIVGARLHDYGKGTPDELFATGLPPYSWPTKSACRQSRAMPT